MFSEGLDQYRNQGLETGPCLGVLKAANVFSFALTLKYILLRLPRNQTINDRIYHGIKGLYFILLFN